MRAAAAGSLQSPRVLKRRSHLSSAPGTRRLLPRSEGEAAAPPCSCPGSPVVLSGRVPVAPTFQTRLRLFHRSHQRMWPNSRKLFEVSTAELFSDSGSVVLMNGCRGGVAKNKATAVGIQRPPFWGTFCADNVPPRKGCFSSRLVSPKVCFPVERSLTPCLSPQRVGTRAPAPLLFAARRGPRYEARCAIGRNNYLASREW